MQLSELAHLPILKPEEVFHDIPNYRERAEVCFESKIFLGTKRITRTQLYVKGIVERRQHGPTLEAFRDIYYDERGRSSVADRINIPLESITDYRPLAEYLYSW
jgi:hypothetical protein